MTDQDWMPAMEYIGRVKNGVVVLETDEPPSEGTRVRVLELPPASPNGGGHGRSFWEHRTLADLIAEQKAPVVQSIDEVLGGWPEDEVDDAFEDSWKAWRQQEGARFSGQ